MDLAAYVREVEGQMRALLASPEPALVPFYGMMAYHLGWLDRDFRAVQVSKGKRVRPLLCLLACEAQGGDHSRALPAAAALELIHNFSLIHDDIEDASPLRRHRATVWHLWGIPQAINAGDGMLMLAHLALQPLRDHGVEADKALAVSHVLDATCLRLCQGQYLDLVFEERLDIAVEEYLHMIGGKSASLIAASTEIGALLAADDPRIVASWREFGWEMGLAFQMVDDILGIWGDPQVTGKSAASDILSKKKTLSILYALATLREGDAEEIAQGEALRRIYQQEELSASDVAQVLALLDAAGAREYVQTEAEAHTGRALATLDRLGLDNPAANQLREIASSFLKRTS